MKKGLGNFLKKHWIVLSLISILIIWILYSYLSQGIFYSLVHNDIESLIIYVNSFGFFSAIIFVLLVILEVVLAPIPPLVLYIIGGALFGSFFGGILTLTGNLVGSLIDFRLARRLGRDFVEKRTNPKIRKKFDKFSEKHGGLTLFLLRLNPLTTSDLFSYLAGLTKMKTWRFLLATGLGLIPLIFVQTYLGDFFLKENPIFLWAALILGLLYLLLFFYLILKSFRKNKK